MKLSKRLKHIEQMVTSRYTHIWDCCCDHGFLGAALLKRNAADKVHFVDIVPNLMVTLETHLNRLYPDVSSQWQTHCIDVATLPLVDYQGTHLVIIAGVGGDLMNEFVSAIHRSHPDMEIDFLLCPVHHQFVLREKLIEMAFSLKDEVLVEDNQRFYEIILVSNRTNEQAPVSPVGEKIWHAYCDDQAHITQRYLTKSLAHYSRIQRGNAAIGGHIIEAYQAVTLNRNQMGLENSLG
ncbi:tRNA (adenine(22)-N(1))-methyltransferase TrmK [Enterovibrio sp. ZSDZ42]|uniref:tRNA (Adenine(22)-N(1))-methyltransferase TrmK n=1 Tax=Enterovibrio gelatinilyticus TaxID=2899819 RepID=A0ABT5R5M8_9GAMM|nr:tRNA (adenine(22)-N(1))-methyltransferase TrmK [Enterovibrio sp. ZSDZ42]MDD1794787.1 tRNA (adenine(22)-N(1))-methyltransferase TrmK [Enterovibrio sp. ZSDZ42]